MFNIFKIEVSSRHFLLVFGTFRFICILFFTRSCTCMSDLSIDDSSPDCCFFSVSSVFFVAFRGKSRHFWSVGPTFCYTVPIACTLSAFTVYTGRPGMCIWAPLLYVYLSSNIHSGLQSAISIWHNPRAVTYTPRLSMYFEIAVDIDSLSMLPI